MSYKTFRVAGAAVALALALACGFATPGAAQSIIQQCGQQYQAAKAANTLNGMTWNQFRADCSARLKATPAALPTAPAAAPAPAPAVVAAPAAPPPANPLKPVVAKTPAPAPAPAPMPTVATAPATAPTTAPAAEPPATAADGKPMSPGRAAFITRERQCGAEWRATKTTLIAQTPGLTWPKYFSSCNARLKAAVK